jgi:hypothetical protein
VNLDVILESIFKLDNLSNLLLRWNVISLDMIKSALQKQGGKKGLEVFSLDGIDRSLFDADILEICSYLPNLQCWDVVGMDSTFTIDGVLEWKRICPLLGSVRFGTERMFGTRGMSEEVEEALMEMGINADESEY